MIEGSKKMKEATTLKYTVCNSRDKWDNYTHYDLGHDVHELPKAIYLHLYPSIKLYSNSPIAKAKDEITLVIDE